MFIFSYAMLFVAIIVIVVAMYYTRQQYAENKRLTDRFKNGGVDPQSQPATDDSQPPT